MSAEPSIGLLAAAFAGLLSFVSPCVLPLVPGYLSFISGVNMAAYRGQEAPPGLGRRVALLSLSFVLGFSVVFIALGAAASVVGATLQAYKRELARVGGVVVILLGLHTAGLLPLRWLLVEKRAEVRTAPRGLAGAFVVGLAFAFGWTPCIGPILGTILLYAAQQETVGRGVALLAAYSAGLGVPFVVAGLAVNAFFAAFTRLRPHLRAFEVLSGVLLVVVGVLLLTDRLSLVARTLTRLFPVLSTIG